MQIAGVNIDTGMNNSPKIQDIKEKNIQNISTGTLRTYLYQQIIIWVLLPYFSK